MKTAVGVGIGAVVLIAATLLVRSRFEASEPETLPAVPEKEEQPQLSPHHAPSVEPSAPPAVDPPAGKIDARQLLSDLAQALRSGNLDRARSLLADLRDYLLPPVPDEQNAAPLYVKALPLMDLPSRNLEADKAYSAILRGEEPSPEELSHLKEWLAKHSERIAEGSRLLRKAAGLPHCRFIPESEHNLGPDTTMVLQMNTACSLLSIQAYLAHREGRSAEAGEIVRTAWALSQNGRTPPQIIHQMLGVALEAIVFDSLSRDGTLDRPEIASSISQLDPSYGPEAWKRSLLGEVYFASSLLLGPEGDSAQLADLPTYIESFGEVLDLPPSRYEDEKLLLEALGRKYGKDSPLGRSQLMIPILPQVKRAMMISEVRRAVFQVALEVERYRSRRGAYPQTLDALGVALPVDPLTGGPFDYRLEGDHVLIQTSSAFRDREKTSWRSKTKP